LSVGSVRVDGDEEPEPHAARSATSSGDEAIRERCAQGVVVDVGESDRHLAEGSIDRVAEVS
jgi:hypothetical protein